MDVGQYEHCTPKVRFAQKHDFFEMAAILTLLVCENLSRHVMMTNVKLNLSVKLNR